MQKMIYKLISKSFKFRRLNMVRNKKQWGECVFPPKKIGEMLKSTKISNFS